MYYTSAQQYGMEAVECVKMLKSYLIVHKFVLDGLKTQLITQSQTRNIHCENNKWRKRHFWFNSHSARSSSSQFRSVSQPARQIMMG